MKVNHLFSSLLSLFIFISASSEIWSKPLMERSIEEAVDTTILIKAIAGMQYDEVRLVVRPGSTVQLILENTDDMSHNLVITEPGTRMQVVEAGMALAERGPEMDFIPDIAAVKWSIPVVSPGEIKTITFTVPDQESILPFVCTYPGHGYIMFGAIYVTNEGLPPLESDINIPESRRKGGNVESMLAHTEMKEMDHPYPLTPPYFYRIFMPNASPASIAVRLTEDLSYCWDATTCQLLYAWTGGFIDNTVAWKGHKNTEAKLLGDVFYNSPNEVLIRIDNGATVQEKEYLGFKLIKGYPEFHYLIAGLDVYEMIQSDPTGSKMVQTIRIPDAKDDVWIRSLPGAHTIDGISKSGWTIVPAVEANEITIEIPKLNKQ